MIKIAIVEDLQIVLEGIKLIINQVDDFTIVAEYKNGKEFTDDLDHLEADIVLTDIDMPVMDGVAATRYSTALRPELKIIALSMHSDRKYYFNMIAAGAKGFVLKQSSPEELEQAVREVYNNNSFFSTDLLHSIIVDVHGLKDESLKGKKELLDLTEREEQLINLVCQGLTNKELAEEMFVSVRTVESNKSRLMQKTNTKNNAGLIIWAIKNKVVTI